MSEHVKTRRRKRGGLPELQPFLSTLVFLSACSSPAAPTDAGLSGSDAASWHVVLQDLEPALLCVWGATPTNVFAVGGPRGNGTPSAVLHYDGHGWKDLSPGGTETFWWAHGASGADVWFVGERGRIAHWDGSVFKEHASGTMATLYGVWAAAADDVWAVGGTPEGGTTSPNDVVLHFDGTSWVPLPPPQTLGRAFFKVWGTTSANMYVVGEFGTIWHRIGGAWTLESNPARGNLTTVAGCSPSEVYAVGGRDVLRSDGTAWSRVDVALTNDVSGVACAVPGNVAIVGAGGLKQRLVAGRWQDEFASAPHNELHGAWADPVSGAFWAAGGDFITDPVSGAARHGVLAYFGTAPPSGSIP